TVGLVTETAGKESGQILDGHGAQQMGVNCRNAVGAMRADNRKVGHPHVLRWPFLDQAHTLDEAVITRMQCSDLVQQTAIDLENDLLMTRQQDIEPLERPLLECFG